MANDYDSDFCGTFEGRMSEPYSNKIEGNEATVEELPSNFLSLEGQSFSIPSVPAAKEVSRTVPSSDSISESFNGLVQKKNPKCSSSGEFDPNGSVQERQETVDSELRFVSESVKEIKEEIVEDKLVCGIQEFDNQSVRVQMGSCVDLGENQSEGVLENKENLCLVEPEVESIYGSNKAPHAFMIADFDSIKIKEDSLKCSLKIEVIDETAVIDTAFASRVGNRHGKGKGFVGLAKDSERNGGNDKNVKQVVDGKEKRSRRKGNGGKHVSGTIGQERSLTHIGESESQSQFVCEKKGDESKKGYSRKEMEAMRFVNVGDQNKKWTEVYTGLGVDVAKEYDGLVERNNQKHIRVNFDPRRGLGKKEHPSAILGESEIDENMVVAEECSEDGDSDEDYISIQRPAFLVTGQPDFDSGPPEDGLEYLRRVRWEAAQIPKVKVAKLEKSKENKEQTVYMPNIPDIAKCPDHLVPLRQWEDAFLADFSELRLAVSRLECSNTTVTYKHESPFTIDEEENSIQLRESSTILESSDNLTADGIESSQAIECSIPKNSNNPQSVLSSDENESVSKKSLANGSNTCKSPTLSVILKMDSVARISMLRKRINALDTMTSLSRNDCEWLFGLCAAVDTPLDADMCAALRCLLRKCASLRAGKSELDEEVIMLNVLATISGRYFGQSEKN